MSFVLPYQLAQFSYKKEVDPMKREG